MSCKPTLHKTGVYEIVNIITNERYIGTIQALKSGLTWFDIKID